MPSAGQILERFRTRNPTNQMSDQQFLDIYRRVQVKLALLCLRECDWTQKSRDDGFILVGVAPDGRAGHAFVRWSDFGAGAREFFEQSAYETSGLIIVLQLQPDTRLWICELWQKGFEARELKE